MSASIFTVIKKLNSRHTWVFGRMLIVTNVAVKCNVVCELASIPYPACI